jgi:hypothetical protein
MTYEDFLRQVQKDLQDSFANQTEEKYAKVTIGIGNVNKIQGESYRGITFVNGESPIKGHFNMQQLLRSFFLFLPTATLQQIIFSFYYRFVIQACCFLKRVFFCVLIDDR